MDHKKNKESFSKPKIYINLIKMTKKESFFGLFN